MTWLWNKITTWFASKGGFAHVAAGLFAAAVLAYAQVPAFSKLVTDIYNLAPSWAHELALAFIGLYLWYKNTQSKVA